MTFFTDMLPEAFQTTLGAFTLIVVFFWSSFWKILALYRSASRKQKVWFVVLFFVNTVGILEIIYLLVYNNRPKRA